MDFGAEAIHKCHYCQQVIKGDKYRESNVVTFISDFLMILIIPIISTLTA